MTSEPSHSGHILMICTVGGTPEPLVKSLLHWRPDRIVFIPSEQTQSQLNTVLQKHAEAAGRPVESAFLAEGLSWRCAATGAARAGTTPFPAGFLGAGKADVERLLAHPGAAQDL